MCELSFPEQALNRFNVLENKIKKGSKGLQLLSSYFSGFKKRLDNLCNGLQKSLDTLIDFMQLNKTGKDSLTISLDSIIKNESNFYNLIKTMSSQYQDEVLDSLNLFIKNYENTNKEVIGKGSKLISIVQAQKNKVSKARDAYYKHARGF